MKPVHVMAMAACLAVAAPSRAADALKSLQSPRGTVTVEYERATAEVDEFARLAPALATVRVVAAQAGDADAVAVAAAYARGLQAHAVSAPGAPADAGVQYLAEVVLGRGAGTVEDSEKVYGTRQTGVACRVEGNSVGCKDMGSAPIEVGSRAVQRAAQQLEVTIRLFRDDDQARVVVAEDRYAIRHADGQCPDLAAAAATVAEAVAGQALSARPLHIRFRSHAGQLRCTPS